ncbi:MAG: hypothetical protein V8R11_02395 [Alphaproteobacteria bacterium]
MTEEKVMQNNTEIDVKKAQLILQKIIIKENNNIKRKDKNDGEMVKMIQKLIQEEVECY